MKKFLKEWTLPVAIAVGIVVYVLFGFVPLLEPIGEAYAPMNRLVLPICSFVVLYVTFCILSFRGLGLRRWHLWLSLAQIVLVALLMSAILLLKPGGAFGVALQAALVCVLSPTATAAAVVTQKLGGSIEQMTSYTLVSNFLAAVLIPACFVSLTHLGNEAGAEATFMQMFWVIMLKVSSILLLPLGLSQLTKYLLRPLHRAIVGVSDLGFYLWSVALVIVTATTVMNIRQAWGTTSALALLGIAMGALMACAVQFWLGRKLGRGWGCVVEAGQGLGQKNTTFAIWASTAFLDPLSSVGPGCYILWQNMVNAWQIRRHGRG